MIHLNSGYNQLSRTIVMKFGVPVKIGTIVLITLKNKTISGSKPVAGSGLCTIFPLTVVIAVVLNKL